MSPKGFSYKRDLQETEAAFARQVANMRRSASAFDAGHLEEAERLATSVYAICHDGGRNSISLLTQLNLKRKIRLPTTVSLRSKEPGWLTVGPPLLALRNVDGEIEWGASCEGVENMKMLQFATWWEELIFHSPRGATMTRKSLVYALRSQDGGAHVDPELKLEGYYWFMKDGQHHEVRPDARFQVIGVGDGGPGFQNAHWYSMRQICYELDCALIDLGF